MTHVICENYFIQQHLCLPASLAPKGEKKKKNLTRSANAYDFPNNNNKKRNNNTGVLRISVTAEVINWNFWFTETDWLQLNWLKLIDQGLIKIMNCLQLLKIGSCFIKPCQSPSVGMRYSVSMSFFHEHHLGHTNFSANKLLHTSRMQWSWLWQSYTVKNKKLLLCHKNSTTGQCCCSYGQTCTACGQCCQHGRSEDCSTVTL